MIEKREKEEVYAILLILHQFFLSMELISLDKRSLFAMLLLSVC